MNFTDWPFLRRRGLPVLLVFAFLSVGLAPRAVAQLGGLISPGPLSEAHAKLDGLENCNKCHEQGRKVSAARCLLCHKPIADRIAEKRGVHRDTKDDCVSCHVEHAGRKAQLRPFDVRKFDHATRTGFALEGKHAPLATECAKCHKTRSFLGLRRECASCHADAHKGQLGTDCEKCHAVTKGFKEAATGFDHSKTRFPLEMAHQKVPCAKCHVNNVYKGLRHDSCAGCHKNPHKPVFGSDCRSCHRALNWKVETFDHAKTGTPLLGKHQTVPCAKCHVRPAMEAKLKPLPCAGCHKDPHRGEFQQDCGACHRETGFRGVAFDHGAKTRFLLSGKHAALACASCHKAAAAPDSGPGQRSRVADFRGLKTECAACHKDPHEGQLGSACEKCHTPSTFKLSGFAHPRFPEFFKGQHANVACEKCHRSSGDGGVKGPVVSTRVYRNLSTDCVTCHRDVHLGQTGPCTKCHAVDGAKFAPLMFQHDKAAFPLTGRHTTVQCRSCHKMETGDFPGGKGTAVRLRGLPTQCASCHKDAHLGQVGTKCESCHTTASFAVTTYTHRNPGDFFRGRHATGKCQDCHRKLEGDFPSGRGTAVRLTGLGSNCAACHKDPHAGQLGQACDSCHTTGASWKNASRAFHKAGLFPLEGRHLATPCTSCHQNGVIKGTPTTCFDCHWVRHQDDRYRTRLGNQCQSCHRPASWSAVIWDHGAQTGSPLSGAHRGLACDQCHKNAAFAGTTTDCASCHLENYRNTRNPNHVAAGFPTTCQTCHRPADTSWNQAHFDHTSFPLTGVHQSQVCAACHKNDIYKGTPRTCGGCHLSLYNGAKNPDHAAAGFSTSCETCHRFGDASWQQGTFSHATFPLAGVHATRSCVTCHQNGVYKGTARTCSGCHQTDFTSAKSPNHVAAGFPSTCEMCHKFTDPTWHQAVFSHSTFPLSGVHTTQLCSACHQSGVYAGTSRTCAGCHQARFDASKAPNHVAAGFSTACETCHNVSDATWTLGRFNHAAFPLAGVHASQACAVCHPANVFGGTPRTCSGCHQAAFNSSKNPNHAAAGFSSTCETCHKFTDSTWHQGLFGHATFLLAGAHVTQTCAVCHKNDVYRGTPRTCLGCHQADYSSSKSPSHATAGFPTACEECHKFSDATWHQGLFNHTTFPLAGVHITQTCSACHLNGVYKGTARTCSGCHLTDYNTSKNPNHVTAVFPTTCDTCHKFSDATWSQGLFNHATFPLAGVHLTQPCTACHLNSVYKGTARTCSGCHLTDYNSSKDPNHVTAGFPPTCEACHKFTDSTWHQGAFNHVTFPLAGVHLTQPCAACHKNGVYKGTATTCSGCHQADYNTSKNPIHVSAGFPTTCDLCHKFTDATWHQGVFNHTTFPLAGIHLTQPCFACHKNGVYKGTATTCAGCHLTDYSNSKNPNHVTAGFPTLCDTCHKYADSSWQQAVFIHSTFVLAGVHTTQPCTACHKNGVYAGTPRTCSGCHLPAYNSSANPNHVAAGFPTSCESCHKYTDGSWHQGVFSHTWFPIASGRHSGNPCSACHTIPSNFHVFTCLTCHDKTRTDSDHREVGAYRYDSVACYACHPQGRGD